MHDYPASRSSLWQVLVSLVATLWMVWEVLTALAGTDPALVRVEYGIALVLFFGLSGVWHYKRWRAAQDATGDAMQTA